MVRRVTLGSQKCVHAASTATAASGAQPLLLLLCKVTPPGAAEQLLRQLNSSHLWLPDESDDFGLDDVAGEAGPGRKAWHLHVTRLLLGLTAPLGSAGGCEQAAAD